MYKCSTLLALAVLLYVLGKMGSPKKVQTNTMATVFHATWSSISAI